MEVGEGKLRKGMVGGVVRRFGREDTCLCGVSVVTALLVFSEAGRKK